MIWTELDHRIDLRPPLHRCHLHCSTLALHTSPKQRHNCTFSLNMRLIVLQLQKEGTTLPKPAAQQKACYGSSCSSSCSLCILSQVLLKTSAVGESEWLYPDSCGGGWVVFTVHFCSNHFQELLYDESFNIGLQCK